MLGVELGGLLSLLLHLLLHLGIHIPKLLFYLFGSVCYGNNEVKNQFVEQIEYKELKCKSENVHIVKV